MAFNVPTDISGCYCWYNAGAITGIITGHLVTNWNDSSGSGNNLSGGIGSVPASVYQPIYYTNVINGQPAVWFAQQSGSYLATPFTSALASLKVTDGVWFSVYNTPATGLQCFFSQEFGTNNFFPTLLHGHTKPSGWSVATGTNSSPTYVDSGGILAPTGEFLIRCDRRKSGFQQFIKNGVTYASGLWGTAPAETAPTNGIFVGGNFALNSLVNATGLPWSGHIAEIIGYNRELSDFEISEVTQYLMFKYFINAAKATLYTVASNTATSSTTLYLNNFNSSSSSTKLYIGSSTRISGVSPLYIGSSLSASSQSPLYIGSSLSINKSATLWLSNIVHVSGATTLYIPVTSFASGLKPLYVSGVGLNHSQADLFLKNIPPSSTGPASSLNSIRLFISVPNVTGVHAGSFFKNATLYTNAPQPFADVDLFLKGPRFGTTSGVFPLYLGVKNTVWNTINKSTTLFVENQAQTTNLSARLFINGLGDLPGGLFSTGAMNLFIDKHPDNSVSMFIKSVGVASSVTPLYIKSTVSKTSPLFVQGGAMTKTGTTALYLPGPSSVLSSVQCVIPKTFAVTTGTPILYIYGF